MPGTYVTCENCGQSCSKAKMDRHKECWECRKSGDKENQPPRTQTERKTQRGRTRTREPRDFHTLSPSGQRKRLKTAHVVLEEIGVPPERLSPKRSLSPVAVLRQSRTTRDKMRTIPGLSLASEKLIRETKEELKENRGTAIATFERGAYVHDPISLLEHVIPRSSVLAVGGDCGGNQTKFGVTYITDKGTQEFVPLLVYQGKDTWEELAKLTKPGLTPFAGKSSHLTSIFHVLQHLIDARLAFLNGDWKFLSCLLGLKGPSSTNPCFICCCPKNQLLLRDLDREDSDPLTSYSRAHPPLLKIPPSRIVPIPLHVFLGIGNRIINKAYKPLLGAEAVQQAVSNIKTVHLPGNGGLADLHDLNGPELDKWIKRGCDEFVRKHSTSAGGNHPTIQNRMKVASTWLPKLQKHLLGSHNSGLEQKFVCNHLVKTIHQRWTAVTGDTVFPKLHMLHHCKEFMQSYGFLGLVSEASIERHHAAFNELFNRHHFNLGENTTERLTACLRVILHNAVWPKLVEEEAAQKPPSSPSPARKTRTTTETLSQTS